MKIYVGNLGCEVTAAELSDLGEPFGELLYATVSLNRDTGASRGFGFLEFTTEEAGYAAIDALDGREIAGRQLRVNESKRRIHLATPL